MKENTIEKIMDYFDHNEELFNRCIEELDDYNGYLADDRYYEMEMLEYFISGKNVLDVLNMAFFGHDKDNFHTNAYGDKEYGSFNPNREYFTFNAYGNLVSTNYKDYSLHNEPYTIKKLSEYRDYISTIDDNDDLLMLFNELEW